MSLTLPLPTLTRDDLRAATVLFWGLGLPVATLTVRVDGEQAPCVILAPAKDCPSVGSRILVKRCQTAAGGEYWQLAGGRQ
jgi:hypothetical protein